MQPRSSMATVLPASSPGPRGPCCWVIPSARCATSGSTRNGRRVGFSTTPPRQKPAGDISPAAGASRHHHQPWARCAPGRSPARDPWRSGGMGGREAPTRVRTAPASGSRRAPSRASERASRAPRGGARVSHLLPRRSGPRRARCSPGAPHLPLEPHLSLSFLTCSRLSPVLSLTPKWPSTSSTVFV